MRIQLLFQLWKSHFHACNQLLVQLWWHHFFMDKSSFYVSLKITRKFYVISDNSNRSGVSEDHTLFWTWQSQTPFQHISSLMIGLLLMRRAVNVYPFTRLTDRW